MSTHVIAFGAILAAFKKLPAKYRYTLYTTLVLFLVGSIYQAGVLSNQVHKNTQAMQQVQKLIPAVAAQTEATKELTNRMAELQKLQMQMLLQQRKHP